MKNHSIIFMMLALVLSSCSERDNPISPITSTDTPAIFLGKIGTQRVYREVIKWFVPNTDSAFLRIPDSLLSEIRLTPEQLRQGVVSIKEITQVVDTIPNWYYTFWNLPSPYTEYKDLNGRATGYDLSDHLQAILQRRSYSGVNATYGWGKFLEKSDSIINLLHPYGAWPYLLKPLSTGRYWLRNDWEYYDSSAHRTRTHNIAGKVIGKTTIAVEAGTFEAYKIEISMNWPDLNYSVIWKYEYYVPNVGLALEESDLVQNIVTLIPGGPSRTITVRIVSRSELASFNIIR
jgi:hypothetical protein